MTSPAPSSPATAAPAEGPIRAASAPAPALAALRAELDTIDNAIHDLLQQRAVVVEQVATQGGKGSVAIRPGREADIIRRLLRDIED